jgi:hypothetical protein
MTGRVGGFSRVRWRISYRRNPRAAVHSSGTGFDPDGQSVPLPMRRWLRADLKGDLGEMK